MRSLWRHVFVPMLVGVLVAVFISPSVFAERRRRQRFGFIEVSSFTQGAEVFIDGENVGSIPLPEKVRIAAGEHSVKVSKRGHTQHLEVVAVKARQTVTVEADLMALSGVLRVEANVPDARVFVDDDYVGDAPIEQEVEPGARHLRVTHSGYYDFEQDIEVIAGEETAVTAELEEEPAPIATPVERRWYEQWWVWTIVGAVVVTAAIAIPVGISQQSDYCADVAGWESCDVAIPFVPFEPN